MKPAKTPTVAIARVLRALGLKQGDDFRVTGMYQNGGGIRERIGTYVVVLSRRADDTIAANADAIQEAAAEAGFSFRVSIYYSDKGRVFTSVRNFGQTVRQDPPIAPADALPAIEPSEVPSVACGCENGPHREADGTCSHWAGCPVADAQQAAGTPAVTGDERAADLAHLIGRTFRRTRVDYQTQGWPTIDVTATVVEIVPDYLPWLQTQPNVGVRFTVRDERWSEDREQSMTLAEFRRHWINPAT